MHGLSHRPTLITIKLCFGGFEIFYMENATEVELGPTSFVAIIAATKDRDHVTNWLGFNGMQFNYWPCVILCATTTNITKRAFYFSQKSGKAPWHNLSCNCNLKV